MESVKNVVNTATETIWGKNDAAQRTAHNETAGQEPVSGRTGAGNVDEPFDKGNLESGAGFTPSTSSTENSQPSFSERTQPSTTNPTTSGTADSTGANVNTIAFKSTPKPQDVDTETPTPSQSTEDTTFDAIQRAESGERITDEERETLAEQGKLPKDPNDHSGEPMKMHGGADSLDAHRKTERSKSVAQEGGGEHGKEKGTGQEWVKTSGFAAEGGDFDATKPGAGREATRLLEDKGIKRDGDNHGPVDLPAGTGEKPAEKSSLADKIKDKLHIGTGKHV